MLQPYTHTYINAFAAMAHKTNEVCCSSVFKALHETQLQSKKVIMGLLLGVLVFTFPVIVNDSNMQILHGVSWLFSTLFF